MNHGKIINLLNNTPNQPTKLRTKLVELNDTSCGTCNTDSQIKFKASVVRSSLSVYSYAQMLVSGIETVPNRNKIKPKPKNIII